VVLAALERAAGEPATAAPDTRAAAVVAFADELLESPELLSAYAGAVNGDTPVTLVIHAPPARAGELGTALGDAVAAAGLEDPDAADLLLHPCDSVEDLLAAPVRAVYTRRAKPAALTTLPRLDDTSIARLAQLI
jgi:hypothetical protein